MATVALANKYGTHNHGQMSMRPIDRAYQSNLSSARQGIGATWRLDHSEPQRRSGDAIERLRKVLCKAVMANRSDRDSQLKPELMSEGEKPT